MTIEKTELSRRTLVKGAAWSLPVIAVAAATPMAAASTATASVEWTGSNTTLLTLTLLNGGPVAGVNLLPSAPTTFRVNNTPGAIPNVTAVFSVSQANAPTLSLSLGDRYLSGFAPVTIPDATRVGETTVSNRLLNDGLLGDLYAQDTTTTFNLGDIASGAVVDFGSIAWGTTGQAGAGLGVDVDIVTTFNITVSFLSDGTEFAVLSGQNLTVPVNAGIL